MMRTVVVHEDDIPEEWSLIERFFNPGISSGSLTFFRHQASRGHSYPELLNNVSDYLRLRMVEDWQLVWVMNVSQEKDFRLRLSSQLKRFRTRVLDKLQEKTNAPSRVFLMAFDGVDRHSDGSPTDPFLKQVWELDIQGYLPEKLSANGNLFFEDELKSIDEEWDVPLDLKKAGPLEAPSPEFLQLLENRINRVKEIFSETIWIPKKTAKLPADILSEDELAAIKKEFYYRLNRISIAPLSPKLAEYKPSKDLREVLKNLLGINESIAPYIFIRVPLPQDFPARRTMVLLKTAYLLNAISIPASASRLWREGNAYTFDVIFREQELHAVMCGYLTKLYIGKAKVVNSLQDRRQQLSPDYGDWTSVPYGQTTLLEADLPKIRFNNKDRIQFEQELNHFEGASRELLKRREQQVAFSAREGMRKLDVLKKLKEEPYQMSKEEPEAALHSLYEEAEELREQMVRYVIPKPHDLASWDSYIGPIKQNLTYLLRSIPQARQIGWLIFVILTLMLTPYLVKWNEGAGYSDSPSVLSYMVYPVIIVMILLIGLGLSKLLVSMEIKRQIQNSSQRVNELIEEQGEKHKADIAYLNKLYKLRKLSDRAQRVHKFQQDKHRETVQLRYHQFELQQAIDAGERLSLLLGISLRDTHAPSEHAYDERAWFENDSVDHPVYSPHRRPNDGGHRGDEAMELVIGLTRDTIRDARLYPAARIVCEQDRAFRV